MANFNVQERSLLPLHALLQRPPLPMAGAELAGNTVVDDELAVGVDRGDTQPASWTCDQCSCTGPFAQKGPLRGV